MMNMIHTLSRGICRSSLVLAFALLAGTLHALPTLWWAAVNTEAYDGDASPSTAGAAKYSAYYCTTEAAKAMFGSDDVANVESYLTENFSTGKTALESGGTAIGQSGYYEADQYTFISQFADAIASGSYLAVAFYDNAAFRVFGADNAVLDSGTLTFDDAESGTVGHWTAVPEPTSGMLLLIGSALLALRRKQKEK